MITKSDIAGVLGLSETDIDDYVYSWAQDIFYTITGFKDTETQKWYREFVPEDTNFIVLPDNDIKSIDVIKEDNTTEDFVAFTDYTLNPSNGFIYFETKLDKNVFLEIQYTVNAHTYTDIDGYLISLLTYKGLALFTPNKVELVKSVKIGRYSKTFSDLFKTRKDTFMTYLDNEIKSATNLVLGYKDDLTFGVAG